MTWSIADYNTNPDANSNIDGINIAEGCAASGINNAIRQLMADLASGYFALAGITPVNVACGGSGNVTLSGTQAAANMLEFTGTPTAAKNIVFPLAAGLWFIKDKTGGTKQLTLTMGSGTTVTAPQKGNYIVISDGTDLSLAASSSATAGTGDSSSLNANTQFVTTAIATARTAITAAYNTAIFNEAVTRALVDQAETTRAEAAEATLTTNLAAEVTARSASDLSTSIALALIPDHAGTSNVGDFTLWENACDGFAPAIGSTKTGAFLGGGRTGTWKALGAVALGSGCNAVLWTRIS